MSRRKLDQQPERKAAGLLAALWDRKLPVDVKDIARRAGIQVKEAPGLEVSGAVSTDSATATIRINPAESLLRQRFTIAHELGHVFLGHLAEMPELRDSARNYTMSNRDPKERNANRFATALLMPEEAVKAVIMQMENARIEALAEVFLVSKAAMSLRLKTLGVIPAWADCTQSAQYGACSPSP